MVSRQYLSNANRFDVLIPSCGGAWITVDRTGFCKFIQYYTFRWSCLHRRVHPCLLRSSRARALFKHIWRLSKRTFELERSRITTLLVAVWALTWVVRPPCQLSTTRRFVCDHLSRGRVLTMRRRRRTRREDLCTFVCLHICVLYETHQWQNQNVLYISSFYFFDLRTQYLFPRCQITGVYTNI